MHDEERERPCNVVIEERVSGPGVDDARENADIMATYEERNSERDEDAQVQLRFSLT
jgi:hypothetical protein